MTIPDPNTPIRETPPTEPAPRRAHFSTWHALETVFSVAVVIATLFTLWTPANLFSSNLTEKMSMALGPNPAGTATWPTSTPQAKPKIGLVAGHWGNDSGAVCSDGLTEAEINLKIATLVKQDLIKEGYDVDLLEEFDKRLFQYQAMALISIHNDSCEYINDDATGFKIAAALSNAYPEKSTRLTDCLADRYQKTTRLRFHYNSITDDMTKYHAFDEVNSNTPAAIIETGFLNLDRQILTEHTDLVAQGITAGVLCYMRNENVQPTPEVAQP